MAKKIKKGEEVLTSTGYKPRYRLPKPVMVNEYRRGDGVCIIMYHEAIDGKINPQPFRVTIKDGAARMIYDYPKVTIDVITKTEELDSGYIIGDKILDWEIFIEGESFNESVVNYLWLKTEGSKWAVTRRGDIRKGHPQLIGVK